LSQPLPAAPPPKLELFPDIATQEKEQMRPGEGGQNRRSSFEI
jgi:hypothetical protein